MTGTYTMCSPGEFSETRVVDILPALKGEDSFVGQQAVPTSPKAP